MLAYTDWKNQREGIEEPDPFHHLTVGYPLRSVSTPIFQFLNELILIYEMFLTFPNSILFGANCEGQTHGLSLTRRLLYHWAKLAFHFQYCKYTKWFSHFQIYFELDGGFAPPYVLLQSTAWLLDQSSICMDGRTWTRKPSVLETDALPIELHPCVFVPIRGIEPRCVPYERTVLPLNYIGERVSNGNRTRIISVTVRDVYRYTIDTI